LLSDKQALYVNSVLRVLLHFL